MNLDEHQQRFVDARSAFLRGGRQIGKTTALAAKYDEAVTNAAEKDPVIFLPAQRFQSSFERCLRSVRMEDADTEGLSKWKQDADLDEEDVTVVTSHTFDRSGRIQDGLPNNHGQILMDECGYYPELAEKLASYANASRIPISGVSTVPAGVDVEWAEDDSVETLWMPTVKSGQIDFDELAERLEYMGTEQFITEVIGADVPDYDWTPGR